MLKTSSLAVAILAGLSGLAPAQAPQKSVAAKERPNSAQYAQEQQQIEGLRSQIEQLDRQLRPSWDQLRQLRDQMDTIHKKIQPMADQRRKLIEQLKNLRRKRHEEWQEKQEQQ